MMKPRKNTGWVSVNWGNWPNWIWTKSFYFDSDEFLKEILTQEFKFWVKVKFIYLIKHMISRIISLTRSDNVRRVRFWLFKYKYCKLPYNFLNKFLENSPKKLLSVTAASNQKSKFKFIFLTARSLDLTVKFTRVIC